MKIPKTAPKINAFLMKTKSFLSALISVATKKKKILILQRKSAPT